MSKHQHHYEFPLDPTLLDELSAMREDTTLQAQRSSIAGYAERIAHAAREFGARLGRRTHPQQDDVHDLTH